jgi:hypothetical protein
MCGCHDEEARAYIAFNVNITDCTGRIEYATQTETIKRRYMKLPPLLHETESGRDMVNGVVLEGNFADRGENREIL